MALEKGFSKQEVTPGACEWVLTGALSLGWKEGRDLSSAAQPKNSLEMTHFSLPCVRARLCRGSESFQTRERLSASTLRRMTRTDELWKLLPEMPQSAQTCCCRGKVWSQRLRLWTQRCSVWRDQIYCVVGGGNSRAISRTRLKTLGHEVSSAGVNVNDLVPAFPLGFQSELCEGCSPECATCLLKKKTSFLWTLLREK